MAALEPVHRRPHVVNVALGLWVTAWLVAGLVTAVQIRRLTEVSDSLVASGEALDKAGAALQSVARVPVVGREAAHFGGDVRATADEIGRAGASSRQTVQVVSVLLGAALVLIPIVPLVTVYLPLRRSHARQRREVARALRHRQRHPKLEEFLAHRAVQNLPYDVLHEVSTDPWGDLHRGRYRHLANAELTRLGLANRRRTTRHQADTSARPRR